MSIRHVRRLAAITVLALVAMTPVALAKGPPPGKGPGGGGEESLGNNLSVPTIFVGGVPSVPMIRAATLAPAGDTYGPMGPQSPAYPGYWLQKTEAEWRSMYRVAEPGVTVPVTANWSDNLTKHQWAARQPIRVEMVLYDPDEVMTGFVITNLTPLEADRNATYGIDGTTFTTPAAGTEGTVYTRVYVPGARLSIVRSDGYVVCQDHLMTAEINSGGAVTYGFNWGTKGAMPLPGEYRITFTLPAGGDAQITALDPLDLNPVVAVLSEEGEGVLYEPVLDSAHQTHLDITVTANSSGRPTR